MALYEFLKNNAVYDLLDNISASIYCKLNKHKALNSSKSIPIKIPLHNVVNESMYIVLDIVNASIFWKNKSGQYLGANKYVLDMVGKNCRDDILGKTDYALFPQDEADNISKVDRWVMNDNIYKGEEYVTTVNDGVRCFLSFKIPLFDECNNIVGIIGTALDITDKKRLEAQKAAEQEKFTQVVRQMGHDITAPISSINNILMRLGNIIPESERITLRMATERIEGISQKLLSKYDSQVDKDGNEVFLLSLAVMQIVRERREDYRDTGVIIEVDIDASANFACIQHNANVIKRMLTNLIKNAVEATKHKPDGKVTVSLGIFANKAVLIIKDNGCGMPQHIQDKFKAGVEITEGKTDGHGIGLTQVRDAIRVGNGKFEIYANERGTEIDIRFPLSTTPNWIATEIKLFQDDTVLILDDDESIHGSWNSSFKDILAQNPKLRIMHFTQGQEVISYINSLTSEQKQATFLLTDYELANQGLNGIDVINVAAMTRAILVTSYSATTNVQDKVIIAGIKMLPKELAHIVEIVVDQKIHRWGKDADMVWVEDQAYWVDDLVKHDYGHLKVDVYYDPVSFMANIKQYPLNIQIILDTYYEAQDGTPYAETGYDLAKQLHEMGYTKLILCSGEEPQGEIPEYLHVVRKNDLHADKYMDIL